MSATDKTIAHAGAKAGAADSGDPAHTPTSRRAFLFLSACTLLTGCTTGKVASPLPGPVWRPRSSPDRQPIYTGDPTPAQPETLPTMQGVLARSEWTSARPVPARMNTMTPIRYITVHHDGMSVFYETDERSTVARLESIRRSHRDGRNWGDIGYHYAVDRAGRVWECRPEKYQGAHVGNHNEGNVGVLVLGNFDQQSPSSRQLDSLNSHLQQLMRLHDVPTSRVATHREWETARTVCPGANLQSHMDTARRRGWLG